MPSHLSPRRQGELGELSAIEWLSWSGAIVFVPLGHSPDVDLIADFGRGPFRIEVKTGTHRNGPSWQVPISTSGGNQSWNRVVKRFDPERCDYLFVLAGDGRRWFIPTAALDCARAVSVGGTKYGEYEIEPGKPLSEAVALQSRVPLGECQSGQMDQAVNLATHVYGGSNPPSPIPKVGSSFVQPRHTWAAGNRGETRVNYKRKVTLPPGAVLEAGLNVGDRLRARAAGCGRVILERIEPLTTPAAPAPEEAA